MSSKGIEQVKKMNGYCRICSINQTLYMSEDKCLRKGNIKESPLFIFMLILLPAPPVNQQRDAAEYFEKILTLCSEEASQVKHGGHRRCHFHKQQHLFSSVVIFLFSGLPGKNDKQDSLHRV